MAATLADRLRARAVDAAARALKSGLARRAVLRRRTTGEYDPATQTAPIVVEDFPCTVLQEDATRLAARPGLGTAIEPGERGFLVFGLGAVPERNDVLVAERLPGAPSRRGGPTESFVWRDGATYEGDPWDVHDVPSDPAGAGIYYLLLVR